MGVKAPEKNQFALDLSELIFFINFIYIKQKFVQNLICG